LDPEKYNMRLYKIKISILTCHEKT